MPCLYGLGGQAMISNAPYVSEIFDVCAPVCLVGPSGRGKTLTMKMAQALVGMQDTGLLKSAKREAVIAMATRTTLGVWIDDPAQIPGELVVDFYNQSRQETLSRGSEEIQCGLMFTSNNLLKGYTERENRRILYITYGGPTITPRSPEERLVQVELKKKIGFALSSAVGLVVKLGRRFQKKGYKEVINTWEPFVKESTNGLHGDLALHYGILHWFSRQVLVEVGRNPDVLDEFFLATMAGQISALQPHTEQETREEGFTLEDFLQDVVISLTTYSDEKVRDTFRLGTYSHGLQVHECVVVAKPFYVAKSYTPKVVHSQLKMLCKGLGKSQPRAFGGSSVQATLVNLSAFSEDQQTKIVTALKGTQNRVQERLQVSDAEIGSPQRSRMAVPDQQSPPGCSTSLHQTEREKSPTRNHQTEREKSPTRNPQTEREKSPTRNPQTEREESPAGNPQTEREGSPTRNSFSGPSLTREGSDSPSSQTVPSVSDSPSQFQAAAANTDTGSQVRLPHVNSHADYADQEDFVDKLGLVEVAKKKGKTKSVGKRGRGRKRKGTSD